MLAPESAEDEGELWDLFLSHRSVDADGAESLETRLASERHHDGRPVRVWLDKSVIKPGRNVVAAINEGLEKSRYVGLYLTPDYFESETGWADAEWQAALYDDPAGRRGKIVPILAKNCPRLPALLRPLSVIDLRGDHYESEYARLLDLIRNGARPARGYRGQVVGADGRLTGHTLTAERSALAASPEVIQETLLCNLLPVQHLPDWVWIAPISPELDQGLGIPPTFPDTRELQDIIRQARNQAGLKPFSPVFRRRGDEVVTFHNLSRYASPLSPITDVSLARRTPTGQWTKEEDLRRILTDLLNASLQRHLARRGLKFDPVKRRHFFPPAPDGRERPIKWRRHGKPRTVARQLLDKDGRVYRWRHTAARLRFVFVGGHWLIQIRPTVLFTRDGTVDSILKGAIVGPMATQWLARERNLALAYHTLFWAHVLGQGTTPIRIKAGEQRVVVESDPVAVSLDRGIAADHVDLAAELEKADDPDEGLELEEELEADRGEE